MIASLIETTELNHVGPRAWLTDTLTRLADGYRINTLGDIMLWIYAAHAALNSAYDAYRMHALVCQSVAELSISRR